MPRTSEFKWREFNPENKNGTPHENRLCYIYNEEEGVIARYCDEYGNDWPMSEKLTTGIHFCYLPKPPKP